MAWMITDGINFEQTLPWLKQKGETMTEQLKTLKDLTETEWDVEVTPFEYFCMVRNLRQEAIKWIKYKLEQTKELDFIELESTGDAISTREAAEFVINWIKMFFNITEEDLKP